MIGTIRKHQNWLWAIIIAGTIVSFVWFFNPSSRYGGGGEARSSDTGASIEGRAITATELENAKREEMIFYFLQHGEWASPEKLNQQGYQFDQRVYQRIALNQKAQDLGIVPTAKAAARMVEEIFGNRPVSQADLQQLEERTLAPQHMSLEDFARFARHQAANQQLVTLFGMSGKLITPKEVEAFYIRDNEPVVAQIAYFPLSNYMSQVTVSQTNLQSFYETNKAMYRLPERLQVQYVTFPRSNFTAAAEKEMLTDTNFSKQIDAIYAQAGPEQFKDENEKVLSADAAKAKIKKGLIERAADKMARTNAIAFSEDLNKGHEEKNPATLADLDKAAKAHNLTVKTTEPFDGRTGPKEMKVSPMFNQAAFSLDTNAPMAQVPVQYEDGWLVLGLKQHLPSKLQTFDEVKTEVATDYKREKAFYLARDAGQAFFMKAVGPVSQGKGFETVAASNNVKVETLPPFSLNSATNVHNTAAFKALEKSNPTVARLVTGHQEFQGLVEHVYTMQTGKMSSYIPTMDGGYFVYVKERLPVDQAKMQKELPEYLARMREQRQNAAFGEWFQKEIQGMRLVIPQSQQQQMQRQPAG